MSRFQSSVESTLRNKESYFNMIKENNYSKKQILEHAEMELDMSIEWKESDPINAGICYAEYLIYKEYAKTKLQ